MWSIIQCDCHLQAIIRNSEGTTYESKKQLYKAALRPLKPQNHSPVDSETWKTLEPLEEGVRMQLSGSNLPSTCKALSSSPSTMKKVKEQECARRAC